MVTRFGLAEQQARRLAEAEAMKAQATVAFFANLLSKANPAFSRGQDLSVREALAAASAEMAQALASQPEVEATVRQSIGASFNALGSFAQAERELRRAVAVSAHPSVPREVRARSHLTLGQLLADQGRLREASAAMAEAETLAAAGLRDAGLVLNIAHSRLTLQLGLGEGADLAGQSAALLQRTRALQPPDPRLLAHVAEAHAVAIERAEPERSLALRREALAALHAAQGELSPEVMAVTNGLAAALLRLGRFEESAALREGLHERLLGVLGPAHPTTLGSLLNLAHLRQNRGETAEALRMLEDARAAAERLPESLDVRYRIQQSLSTAYFSLGRLDEAEAAGLAASEGFVRLQGERHADSVLAMTSLATLLAHRDKPEQAAPWFARALAATEQNLGPEHPQTLATLSEYAAFLRDAGRLEESLQRFADLLAMLERIEGPHGPQTLITIYQYGGALQQAGRHAEALPLTRRLHERAAAVLGPGNPFTLLAPNRHARSLIGTGDLEQAEALLRPSWDALSQAGNAQFAGFVAESFVQLAEARRDPAGAARWRERAAALQGQ
jgi:tetratricopeptide (TPR) repeat protein